MRSGAGAWNEFRQGKYHGLDERSAAMWGATMTKRAYQLWMAAIALLAAFPLACDEGDMRRSEEPGWHFLGLEEHPARRLEVAYPYLYVSTGADGLFRKTLAEADSDWEYLGLASSDLADSTWEPGTRSHTTDVIALEDGDILAGVVAYAPWFHGLYRSGDGGRSWQPSDTGIADTLCPYESNVSSLAVSACQAEVSFAGTDGSVYRSEDAGLTWSRLLGYVCAGLGVDQLHVHPRSCNVVWAAGETNRFDHYLITSKDGGMSWEAIDLKDVVSGVLAIGRISLDPFDEDVVYLWAPGGPFKTEDGGGTWSSASFGWAPDGVGAITFDDMRQGHFFAVGNDLYESWDGGESARAVEIPFTSAIHDMKYDSGRHTLHVGTTTGVYMYVSPYPPRAPTVASAPALE